MPLFLLDDGDTMGIRHKKELWFALFVLLPTLIVAGLYENEQPFSVTITAKDLDQCGGTVTPSGSRIVKQGQDLCVAISLGDCRFWEGQIRDKENVSLYDVTNVRSGRINIYHITEDQDVTVIFSKAIPSNAVKTRLKGAKLSGTKEPETLLSISQRSNHAPSHSADGTHFLLVGFAQNDITPEIGVPLAGFGGKNRRLLPWDILNRYPYAHFFKPSTGMLDPIRAKAMIIKKDDKHLLFLSLDVVAITAPVLNDIKNRIRCFNFTDDEIFISATHTHSGPGALSQNRFWQFWASDRFHNDIYEEFLADVTATVEQAYSRFTEAQLVTGSFNVKNVQINRHGDEGHFDPKANVLLARSKSGHWLGGLINFAIHGTALSDRNLKFSADIPGAIESALANRLDDENLPDETSEVVLLFMNGAEGDVSPIIRGIKGMNKIGQDFAEQAFIARKTFRPISTEWSVQSAEVHLGDANWNLQSCTGKKNLRRFIPKRFRIQLSETMPRKTRVWTIHFGDMIFLTVPGEATSSLGFELGSLATEAGFAQSWILGLANDYLAYFTTPSEYDEGTYEACSSFYGRSGGSKILEQYKMLLGL